MDSAGYQGFVRPRYRGDTRSDVDRDTADMETPYSCPIR
jgi:hypothetical protein